jgi:hypothetical protein
MRLAVICVLLLGCGKGDHSAETSGSGSGSAPQPADAVVVDAAPPVDASPPDAAAPADAGAGSAAAPTPKVSSAVAAKQRRTFLAKVSKLVKAAKGNCKKLGPELVKLIPEARKMRDLKPALSAADAKADKKVENDALKPVLLDTSKCSDTAKIDSFMDVMTGVKP